MMMKGKAKRRRFHMNKLKRVWDFGIVWEEDIYFHTAGKDGCPDLEQLTGDTIDISQWTEFEFFDLVCFWNNQSDDTKPMF